MSLFNLSLTFTLLSVLAGGLVWLSALKRRAVELLSDARKAADTVKADALRDVDSIRKGAELEAKEQMLERSRLADRDQQRRRLELDRAESRLKGKERSLDGKIEASDRAERSFLEKDRTLDGRLATLERREADLARLEEETRRRSEELSGMTAEEAKRSMMESLEAEVRQENGAMIRRLELETRETAARKARQIVTLAIQKVSMETVTESTCSVLALASDDVKGRIIGREGRNIRALEAATGVNLIVDDTPEAA